MDFKFVEVAETGDVWETVDADGFQVFGIMPHGVVPWCWTDTSWYGSESANCPVKNYRATF